MSWLRTVVMEVWGLFVDDGRFALSILAWLAVGWLLPKVGLPPVLACLLFSAGFAVLLTRSVLARTGRHE